MRWACLVVVGLGGCSFSVTLDPEQSALFCDPADPSLVACYEFEGSTRDASPNALHATMTDVSFVPGKVGLAMQFGATSAADIPDSAAIDVAALTVEAWINPSELPTAGQRVGIADMNGQWGLFIYEPTGRLQCSGGGIALQVDANIAINTWTHVACTYDAGTLTIFLDGAQRFQRTGGDALSTGGTTGISLCADNPPGSGQRMLGLIDQVRISSRARTGDEIRESANP